MESRAERTLAVVLPVIGAVLWLALTVYPFQYGRVESLVLVGLLVGGGFVELVLDSSFAGK